MIRFIFGSSFLISCSFCWSSFDLNTNNLTVLKNLTSKIKIRLQNQQILIGNRIEILELNAVNKKIMHTNIVYEFLGVPFAKPPLNEKRFKFPFTLDKLLPIDEYDASYQRDSCQQEYDHTFPGFRGSEMWNPPGNVSEDCLYMNIWVPVSESQDRLFSPESTKPSKDLQYIRDGFSTSDRISFVNKSTLIWLYGGSYIFGSVNLDVYDGAFFAGVENVIIVSPNYRLGVFGFAYLNNQNMPGNAGIADNMKAIEWYSDNYMKFFGGKNICLFGESAGAMSLQLLLQVEKSYLFNRLILQSSSSYLELAYRKPPDAFKVTLQLAEKVGCLHQTTPPNKNSLNLAFETVFNRNNSNENNDYINNIIDCLVKQDAAYLSQKQFEVDYINRYLPMPFIPTSDYFYLIKQDPSEFDFNDKKILLSHDILAGVNQNEGTYFTFYAYNNVYFNLSGFIDKDSIKYDNNFVAERLAEALTTKNPVNDYLPKSDAKSNAEKFYYKKYIDCLDKLYTINGKIVSMNNLNDTEIDFDLDSKENRILNSPQLAWTKFSKIIGDYIFSCPTIKFENKYSEAKPFNTYFYRFNKRAMKCPWPEWLGVFHGTEIEYIFGKPWLNPQFYDNDDRVISKKIMNYWANFARTGKL